MIEELLIFLGIYVISLGLTNFLFSDRAGILKPIALRICFIGVIFHELAHYGMSLAVGRIPNSISVKWRDNNDKKIRNPHGHIKHERPPSFLQSIIISFAPLYFGTWIIFWLWFGVITNPLFNPLIITLAVFLLISILLTAAPSSGDMRITIQFFKQDPRNSWYQVFLIIISVLILWIVLIFTQISLILDFFYYLSIAAIYLTLKYSFIGLRKLVMKVQSRDFQKPEKVNFKRFSRQHYKPKKPWNEK